MFLKYYNLVLDFFPIVYTQAIVTQSFTHAQTHWEAEFVHSAPVESYKTWLEVTGPDFLTLLYKDYLCWTDTHRFFFFPMQYFICVMHTMIIVTIVK